MNNIKENSNNIVILIFLFCLTRFIADWFKVSTHDTQWLTQTFDISLMRNGLLGNVFYDLYQAPLLNLSIGVIVKLFPSKWPAVITIILSIISLIMVIEIYFSMILFNLQKKIAFWISLIVILNPALIYFERYIIYHTPVAFLLVNMILFLQLYARDKKTIYLFMVYLSMSILVCYRTSFTLYWFAFSAVILLILFKNYKRNLIALSFPLILILTVHFKNQIVFKYWGTSNMIGNNLASFYLLCFKRNKAKSNGE